MKVEWLNVLELFIAGVLIAAFWSFLQGPMRRLAYAIHKINHEGRKFHSSHPAAAELTEQPAAEQGA